MTAKCIKSDPLKWLTVGEVYQIDIVRGTYCILNMGFALSEENFKEMFEVI